MPRILLVNPPVAGARKIVRNIDCAFESKGNYLYHPQDFLQISGVFNLPEWEVLVFDAVASNISAEQLYRDVAAAQAHIIVLAMGDICWDEDFNFLKQLRKHCDQALLLVLGDSFADLWASKQVETYADGIIFSPWDLCPNQLASFVNSPRSQQGLLNGIRRPNDDVGEKSKKVPRRCSISTPQHQLFRHKAYRWPFARHYTYATVFTAWGCPFSCAYCLLSQAPFLYRDYSDVFNELKLLHSQGIKEIYFGDRSFGAPLENIKSLLRAMIESKLNFSWSSYFHPNMLDQELLELIALSGGHTLIIGVENHDQRLLHRYDRFLNQDKLESLIVLAKKLNIALCADFLFGLADQTKDDIEKTIDWAIEKDFDYASFNILAPLAGTTVRDQAMRDGLMQENKRQFDSLGAKQVLPSNCLSAAELIELRNTAVKRFYFRPRYFVKRLLAIRSATHFLIQIQEMFSMALKTLMPKSKDLHDNIP